MASEYLLKLAREQELPEKKRELTPQEKRRNWWDYHKWHVAIAVAAALFLAAMIRDIFFDREPVPDYQIACIGSAYLPADTGTALETALAELGEDLNGDGQVLVEFNEYPLFADAANYQTIMAAQVWLSEDLDSNGSLIFLMEDPDAVQRQLEILAYPDGTVPEEGADISDGLYYRWSDCPVLAGLELGDSQEVLSELYVARRAVSEKDADDFTGAVALWQKLITGAEASANAEGGANG